MLVTRSAYPEREPHLDIEDCLGCSDCNGVCREILQLLAPPPRMGKGWGHGTALAPGAPTRRPVHVRAHRARQINRT